MINSIYSPYKILHHMDRIDDLRVGIQPDPINVHLVISDLCNQNCFFCAYRMSNFTSNQNFQDSITHSNNPNRMIPKDKCFEIIDDLSDIGAKSILFTGGGEPTVHPNHLDIFSYALDKGLSCAINTNGVIFDDNTINVFSRFKWVKFSIDANSDESYIKIRDSRSGVFDSVLENVKALKDASPNGELLIGAGFVVSIENHKSIYDFASRMKEIGVDYVSISAMTSPHDYDYFHDIRDDVQDLIRASTRDLDDDSFRVFNSFSSRVTDYEKRSPDYKRCGIMHFSTYIGADQNAYRCCLTAYNDVGFIGSIKDARFRDVWRSAEKKRDFESFDARGCERCIFNDKNNLINYLLDENPGHVDYV